MRVIEYRPTFMDIDAEIWSTEIESMDGILDIPWIKDKDGAVVEDYVLGEMWIIKNSTGWVIAYVRA